ncbi:hypothetical protein ISN45_Aa06g019080 [Arabidopsis thaliana x Arabidopsis arenosa]|uniref:Uncharacterized protein n=1 Tax=Arabidopsis thaliana x Arabidopsis arenosa TaxID=1240361 RepID=A0A8T1YXE2_9BRAS|nr:hypothetical protein ISN45_Aa06g019080 [Arabidopsis thaliana x Arabidopsis arenosa]
MRTHSKAFSLREAKGCCATFFSSMGVVRILGPPLLIKIQFVDICLEITSAGNPGRSHKSLPHPLWNRNSSRILAFLCLERRVLGYISLYNNKSTSLRVKQKSVTLGHLFTVEIKVSFVV